MPSPSKPIDCIDREPFLWASDGAHPPAEDSCYEPVTAAALQAKRRKIVQAASEQGKAEPKIKDLDG